MHWLFVALLFVSAGELTGRASVIDGDTIGSTASASASTASMRRRGRRGGGGRCGD